MWMSWVVICALVGYTLGQQTGCCTPDQWEGYISELVGVATRFRRPRVRGARIKLSYDFTNKRIAEDITLPRRNGTITVGVIVDFTAGKLYCFLEAKQKCKSRAIKATQRKMCIPAKSKKLGNAYFGIGSKKLPMTTYEFMSPKRRFAVLADVTMVGANCVPLVEVVVGERKRAIFKTRFLATVGFINITSGIKDPSVFKPPAYCQSEDTKEIDEDPEDFDNLGMKESLVQYLHERIMDAEEFEFE